MPAALAHPGPVTEEAYLSFADRQKPYLELVDGTLVERCMGDKLHSRTRSRVSFHLELYRRLYKGGSVHSEGRARFARGSQGDHRLPDVSYYEPGAPVDDPSGRGMAAPTVAIEIRSDSETMASQREKCRWYRQRGVPVCWLLDPYAATAEVFDAGHDGTPVTGAATLTTDRMPGFELPLADIFALDDE